MTVKNARDTTEIERGASRETQAASDLRWVLSNERGRRFMWELLGTCGLHSSTFNPNFGQMAFAEGRRDIGLRLLANITTHDPASYLLAQQEAMDRAALEAELQRSTDSEDSP